MGLGPKGGGRTRTAQQIAAAFAGLLGGVARGLQFGEEMDVRRSEHKDLERHRRTMEEETKREHDLLNEDRDLARQQRADAKKELQNDWMSQMLHRGKSSVTADQREKYGDFLSQVKEMIDKGMSDDEIAKQLDISPSEGTVSATGPIASLLKAAHIEKPIENGRIKITMEDYQKIQGRIQSLDPSLQKVFNEEGQVLQSPMARSKFGPAALRESMANYRAWRAGAPQGAQSRPASQPSLPDSRGIADPSNPQANFRTDLYPQSRPAESRAAALQMDQGRDVQGLFSPDPVERGAAAIRIRQSWFPMLPPTPDEMARMVAEQQAAQGQQQGPASHPADSFIMQGMQRGPASQPASRPAPTQTSGTRRMLPIEKR